MSKFTLKKHDLYKNDNEQKHTFSPEHIFLILFVASLIFKQFVEVSASIFSTRSIYGVEYSSTFSYNSVYIFYDKEYIHKQ